MGAVRTNLPLSWPLILGEVFFFGDGRENGVGGDGAVGAGRPSFGVGDQRKWVRGNDLNAEVRSLDQPRPKGPQGSRWTLASCHSFIFSVVHLAASLMSGELVRRGP